MAKAPKKGKAWGFHRRWPYLAIRVGPPQPSLVVSPETGNLAVGNQLIGGLNIYNGKPFYPHVREPAAGGVDLSSSAPSVNPDWQLPAGNYIPQKFDMRMLHPRTSTTSTYIYENWYTGMDLSLPVCVIGGAWPYKYELLQAPSGMTIGETHGEANYGIITWSGASQNLVGDGNYTIEVLVTDQDGATVKHPSTTWTLTLGTSTHIFIDSGTPGSNTTGDGSIGNPYENFDIWADAGKHDNAQNGKIAVYRAGTYTTNQTSGLFQQGQEWQITTSKPIVHMAYPGETATFSFGSAFWQFEANEAACVGIRWEDFPDLGAGQQQAFVQIGGGFDRPLFYDNDFTGAGGATGVAGRNPACIFVTGPSPVGAHQDVAVVHNSYDGLTGVLNAELYGCQYYLCEGNTISNWGGGGPWGFYPKAFNNTGTIRNNTGLTGNTGQLTRHDSENGSGSVTGNCEVCWNNYVSTGYCAGVGQATAAIADPIWWYRNTFITTQNAGAVRAQSSNGTAITAEKNVFEHSGDADGFDLESSTATMADTDNLNSPDVDYADNSNGQLQGSWRTSNLGTHGHEVSS